ncbi:SNARE-dependent exocytosis protein (Sro7), putative [Babesia caballi]|uniref:SNARE-dependent exocytosis protein (Sro7), putative n=1 Tax=Babesia caballi TaxID=5871 RepID=A0AAV4M224_BABCB|nr:SNARE-dependent exocytosis protein (Sro7), putative [Babesia caballi]
MPLTPLQHPDRKRYRRVAQPMRRHVGRSNARAGNLAGLITVTTKVLTIIPNELLQSLGQLANKTISTGIRVQSLNNLLKLHTKTGCRVSKVTEKLCNFSGQGFDGLFTLTVLTLPILPRHPQDPVNGLLQVGRAVRRGVYWGG